MGLNHSPRIVTNGLVLALDAGNTKSYPGSGSTWVDLSGNGYNGTLTNGPTYSASNGGSIVFDGSNDYIELGNVLNIGTGQFTLEYFGNAATMTGDYAKIASKGSYLNGGWMLAHSKTPSTYSIYFQWGNSTVGDNSIGGIAISVDTVYHVAVSRDSANNIRIYVNGQLQGSTVNSFDFTTNSYNYNIGRSGGGEYWKGNMYCYRHYNRGLTAAEVQQNFNALRGRFGL